MESAFSKSAGKQLRWNGNNYKPRKKIIKNTLPLLVRMRSLLLYSNEIDIEGIVLCSSCFLKRGGGKKAVATVNRLPDVYAAVKPNLDRQAEGYPEAEALRQRVFLGIPAYGTGLIPWRRRCGR